ncbi:FAD/NAD(P)-dependent oxidoreductase [Kutzneria sp. CA-103260]|uniref:FAD/NAD(P)-dependent oxidoreductase n=1 Tax=Kutzneria sp. CA-103260 TaxID=2802641 RepID=UPI001BA7D85C|nr:NAD(P)/FAD-dependent oxidoreductase [Kutzneria sp. CA-103260]QUQ69796.1 FAD-dependent pyridine nucleotide-disulfide oxidoreductase [Kutzneria sp. CA-103260]
MTVVVVGAGPAGVNAAVTAARAGQDVLLIDSAPRIGGQYHRQSFRAKEIRVAHDRVRHLPETQVWAIEGNRLHLTGSRVVTASKLILATGAYDRTLPFPGWDLPGVYTAGAAQAMAKGQGISLGRNVVVAGTGPFLLPVASSLLDVGAKVRVFEANSPSRDWLGEPKALIAGRSKLKELARYAKVAPYFRERSAVIAAHGDDRVREVTVAKLDADWNPLQTKRIPVDAVCVGYGFVPQLELAISAGCRLRDGFVEVDAQQRTSVPWVFAAGEITGIGGAELAAHEGVIAGAAAAGTTSELTVDRRFAEALTRVYPIKPGWRSWLTDDTIICRCEKVTHHKLRAATHRGTTATRAVKLTSRAGLGPCQGRICGATVADLLDLDPTTFARRPIATPIPLGDLAANPVEEP